MLTAIRNTIIPAVVVAPAVVAAAAAVVAPSSIGAVEDDPVTTHS